MWGVVSLQYTWSPNAKCLWLSKLEWVNLKVLLNDNEIIIVEGICHNIHPRDCVYQNPLGNEDVGVGLEMSTIDFPKKLDVYCGVHVAEIRSNVCCTTIRHS